MSTKSKQATHETENKSDDSLQAIYEKLDRLTSQNENLLNRLDKAIHERDEYRKLYELVHMELDRLRRHVFGKRSERVASEQLPLEFLKIAESLKAFESEDAPLPNSRRRNKKKKKAKPHGRKALPEHLPLERIEVPVPLEVLNNPDMYRKIGEDVSETLEWRAASMVRVQIVRPKYSFKNDSKAMVLAPPLPTKPIEKGLAGPGLLAQVIVSKYADCLPLNRLEKIFSRQKVDVSRSTMCGWIEKCSNLAAMVVEAMKTDSLNAHCISTDATGVNVQAPEKCIRAHFFVTIADRDHVVYHYTRHHNGDFVKQILGNFKGYILADAHTVYDQLFICEERIECACWSHARRYFHEALSTDPSRAMTAIPLIRKLFDIEHEHKDRPPDEKLHVRNRDSKPVANAFFDWCRLNEPLVIDNTPIQKALTYAVNQEQPLRTYLSDGRLEMHNNFSELQLRHQAVGRKNWLFLGSEDGGQWNCVFTSLIASARLHDIEPWTYLRDLLILLPNWPKERALELSPKYWFQTIQTDEVTNLLQHNPFWKISSR